MIIAIKYHKILRKAKKYLILLGYKKYGNLENMELEQIKNKLRSYLREYKENSGTFKSFEIVADYVDFLEKEPYTKELLKDSFSYIEEQIEKMGEIAENNGEEAKKLDNIYLDPKNATSSFSDLSVFEKEEKNFKEKINNKQNIPLTAGINIYLMALIIIAKGYEQMKEAHKENDKERVNELMKIIKEESLSIVSMQIKGGNDINLTSTQLIASYMETVNKYIIDEIDGQLFLEGQKEKEKINFDPKNSILNIRGEKVEIQKRREKPYDHYVLEYIFEQEDIFEEADFKFIAEDKLKFNEYDKSKDWHKIRHACDNLNKKVEKSTNGKIKQFLTYSSSPRGWCKINPELQ
jgi:hypothetical protein